MKHKADVYVLIPVSGKFNGKTGKSSKRAQNYLGRLDETAGYECNERISESLQRFLLGSIEIAYYVDDEYVESTALKMPAELILTYQEETGLGVLHLLLPGCELETTQIGDMVSKGYLKVYENNRLVSMKEYVENTFRLQMCGKVRTIFGMSLEDKENISLEYLLVGEVKNSVHSGLRLRNEEISQQAQNNLAVYDFYELYASKSSFVYYTKNFSDDFEENIDEIVLLVFICEIAILQNAAIVRINNQIVDELTENSDISAKQTLRLQVEFGKTIILWDNNIYHYENVQMLSNKIVAALGTNELLDEYNRNKEHIDQIASLKSGIASELEGKVLNVLAFILGIADLVQLWSVIKGYITGQVLNYTIITGVSFSLFLLAIILYRRRRKKHN